MMNDPFEKKLVGQSVLSALVTAALFIGVHASAHSTSPALLTFGLSMIVITWGGLLFKILHLKPTQPPEKIVVIEEKKPAALSAAPAMTAVDLIGALQGKGRLLDFLQEDLGSFEDAQIGAAVRSVHAGCKDAIGETMKPEPILSEAEETEAIVPPGFDQKAIRLTGEVSGHPPFRGVVKHRGWRDGKNKTILSPAEVEVVK